MQEETVDTGNMTAYKKFRDVLGLTRPVCSPDMSTTIETLASMNVDNDDDDDDSAPSCPLNLMDLIRAIHNFRFPRPSRHLSRLNVDDVYNLLAEIIGIQGEDSHWNTCDITTLYLKQKQLIYLLGQYGHHGRNPKGMAMIVKHESIVKKTHDEWQRSTNGRISKRKCIHLSVLSMSPQNQYETHVLMASRDGYHSCVASPPQGQIRTTKESIVLGAVDTKVNETINLVLQKEKRKLFLGPKGIKKIKKKLSNVRTAMGFGRQTQIKHIDGRRSNPVVPDGVPVVEGIVI